MAVGYVSDWVEWHKAVDFTAKIWRGENFSHQDRAEIAEQLFEACRDGKIRARYPDMPLDQFIPLGMWDHRNRKGVAAFILSQPPLLFREDLDSLWRAAAGSLSRTEKSADNVTEIETERRKRGRPPATREATAARMVEHVRAGIFSREQLQNMKQEELYSRYRVHHDTADAAREIALTRLAQNSGK